MAYHHAKTSCPARDKNYLVFSSMRQTNRKDLLWGIDTIQGNYDQDRENFILEFLDVEEYLVLLREQVLDQIRLDQIR